MLTIQCKIREICLDVNILVWFKFTLTIIYDELCIILNVRKIEDMITLKNCIYLGHL